MARWTKWAMGAVLGAAAAGVATAAWMLYVPEWTAPKPIILVVIDTLRADHLALYGYDRPTSTELERWAEGAVVFDRAYAHAPWTKPSIATMITSLQPRDHGVLDWDQMLDERHVTLPQHLKEIGFRTEAYVSHLALDPKHNNFHQGYDVFDTSAYRGRGSPHHIHSAKQITDRSIEALQRLRYHNEPFFLFIHYFDPHDTYLNHPRFPYGDTELDKYDSEISWTDLQLGRLLDEVERLGFDEHAVVAITADHGEEFQDHGSRLHAFQMYEEVLHVPLLVKAPGLPPARIDKRVGLIDLGPTLLDLAGQPTPDTFKGTAIERLEDGSFAVQARPIFAETDRFLRRRAIIDGRYKLIQDISKSNWELYDLQEDPKEQQNLATKRPQLMARLRRKLLDHHSTPRVELPEQELDDETIELLEALGYMEPPDGAM